jgi:hypothetical protein
VPRQKGSDKAASVYIDLGLDAFDCAAVFQPLFRAASVSLMPVAPLEKIFRIRSSS